MRVDKDKLKMTSQAFRRHRSGYEDLDKCNQSSDECSSFNDLNNANNNSSNSYDGHNASARQLNQGQHKMLSISDTAIHLTPHINTKSSVVTVTSTVSASKNQSLLSLNNSISLGSIYLVKRPRTSNVDDDSAYDNADTSNLLSTIHLKSQMNRKEQIWFICYIVLYVIYLSIGGLCFQIIETPVEQDEHSYLQGLRNDFLLKYPQILDDDLEEFLRAVITANDRGISPLRNSSNEMNWGFGQALFFSSTVITTIGYGRVTPLSQTGKIFCMIYAAIGIPLTLVLLTAVVERLLTPANWLLGTLNSKLGHLYQPFNIRLLHLSLVVIVVAVLFFAIPTTIFAYLEPTWGALDAFYYCFISLTTIGLGDYIPGEGVSNDNRSLYKICITAYLVLGLIAMMFVLTIFYDIPQLNLGQLFTESLNGETEKLRSTNTTCYSGPSGLYMPQRDEDTTRRAVVRIRPHGHADDDDDSPSPDEAPTSTINRDRDLSMP